MNASILSRVQHIMADIFQVSAAQITPMSSPDTIENWDSLNHLNVVLALEQEFGIQFLPEEIEKLLSVECFATLLEEKLHAIGKSS
jgi:acyl carrier protein